MEEVYPATIILNKKKTGLSQRSLGLIVYIDLPCQIRFCKETKSPSLAASPTDEQVSVYASVKSIGQDTQSARWHNIHLCVAFKPTIKRGVNISPFACLPALILFLNV